MFVGSVRRIHAMRRFVQFKILAPSPHSVILCWTASGSPHWLQCGETNLMQAFIRGQDVVDYPIPVYSYGRMETVPYFLPVCGWVELPDAHHPQRVARFLHLA